MYWTRSEDAGSILTDPEIEFSSDEHVENNEKVTNNEIANTVYKSEKDDKLKLFQEKVLDEEVDAIALVSSDRS